MIRLHSVYINRNVLGRNRRRDDLSFVFIGLVVPPAGFEPTAPGLGSLLS